MKKGRFRTANILAPNGSKVENGLLLSRLWAVSNVYGSWRLTHRPTGYSAGSYPDLLSARQCAAKLVKTFGVKAWDFNDPDKARELGQAKQIIAEFDGL